MVGMPGLKGDRGFPGNDGPKGYQGIKGANGLRGLPGPQGFAGEDFQVFYFLQNFKMLSLKVSRVNVEIRETREKSDSMDYLELMAHQVHLD